MDAVLVSPELGIEFPFQVTLSHPKLSLDEMIAMSRLLDFHEVRRPPPGSGRSRHDLVVDVLHVRPMQTTMEIKPRRLVTYGAIAKELSALLAYLTERSGHEVEVTEIHWLVDRKGVASDVRAFHKRVL